MGTDRDRLEQIGRDLYQEIRATREADVQHVPVKDYIRFGPRDFGFYDRCQQLLQASGFEPLGDFQLVLDPPPSRDLDQTFIRVMQSADRTIASEFWHSRPLLWMRLLFPDAVGLALRGIEFSTEFEDGTFLLTNNTLGVSFAHEYPGILHQRLPRSTEIAALLEHHLAAKSRSSSPARVLAHRDDLFAAAVRQHPISQRYHAQNEFLTDAEAVWLTRELDPLVARYVQAGVRVARQRKGSRGDANRG